MAERSLPGALKLSWEYTDGWDEICTFGVHWGNCSSGAYSFVHDVMTDFFTTIASELAEVTLTAQVISEWEVGEDFTGWHQKQRLNLALGLGQENWAPPQLAVSLGVRNLFELDHPAGRRRNRSYLGPLTTAAIDSQGRLETASRTVMLDAMKELSDDLFGLDAQPTGWTDFRRLAVCSPTGNLIFNGETLACGLAIDTQRRRREHVAEDTIYVSLT